ncbi:MAG: ABC transporter ATP-binding protein [Rhizobiaceae bacterium]|nr:ABC transporter ATP-binding protein [Rhizobiaceae bacterium]
MSLLLDVADLSVSFRSGRGRVPALRGVSLSVKKGQTLGVVGESGCGKSLTALAVMGLLPVPDSGIDGGSIMLRTGGSESDLTKTNSARRHRGKDMAMIFQEPMTALNPSFTIGEQIGEVLRRHEHLGRQAAQERSIDLLRSVGIPAPESRIKLYPHELSGGMRQRAMIAIAIACAPALLIADEPTTALDVTIQAQVLDLLRSLQSQLGTGILFITHDMGVIAEMADEVAVMYLGTVVEKGPTASILERPAHPYTQGLIRSVPTIEMSRELRLTPIAGSVPSLSRAPSGCRFNTRCPHAFEKCREQEPPMHVLDGSQQAACWLAGEL